ncbi:3-deoxy-D-manno-octulosonic acid transferase [Candidatus Phycorickettsia trachydisci]|nr:3-deoxy-D-manno-octulosonic acid transferase [Candidatus Phycorickettsia trachydisci]
MLYLYAYNILSILLLPFILLHFIFRVCKKKVDLTRLGEKLGIAKIQRPDGELIWLHAASVGETFVALRLMEELSQDGKYFLLTTCTTTSAEIVAKQKLPHLIHQYAPCDFSFCINKFLNYWQPSIGIFIESEIWPNRINLTSQRFKIALLNARMSDRSFARWKLCKGFMSFCLSKFSIILAQSKEDRVRFELLGAKNAIYAGNIKYSITPPKVNSKDLETIKDQIGNRSVLLAASSHEGDEEFILNCYEKLKKDKLNLLLIIAPRHPIRAEQILNLIKSKGFTCSRRTQKNPVTLNTDVYLADTIGELSLFYSLANVSFIGGSLKNGGHNILEASFFKTFIIFGPDMSNFKEIASEYLQNNAAAVFRDETEATNIIKSALNNSQLIELQNEAASTILKQKSQILSIYIQHLNTIYNVS